MTAHAWGQCFPLRFRNRIYLSATIVIRTFSKPSGTFCKYLIPVTGGKDTSALAQHSAGVTNLPLTMYPFRISTDEHVPLKYFITKRLSRITEIH